MSATRNQIQAELIHALARRAEVDEQISTARTMLRALDLQDAEPPQPTEMPSCESA